MKFKSLPLLETYPFLDENQIDSFYHDCANILDLLKQSCTLEKVVNAWIKNSILDFLLESSSDFSSNVITASFKERSELGDIDFRLLSWAESQWGSKLESLYLSNKDYLDQLSCKVIRVEDKYFAYELYHRIKACEITYDQASFNYGKEPERSRSGQFALQPLSSLPQKLVKPLLSLKSGGILKPVSYGSEFAIFQLIEWVPASFDDESKLLLLKLQLNTWLDESVTAIIEYINSKMTDSTLASKND